MSYRYGETSAWVVPTRSSGVAQRVLFFFFLDQHILALSVSATPGSITGTCSDLLFAARIIENVVDGSHVPSGVFAPWSGFPCLDGKKACNSESVDEGNAVSPATSAADCFLWQADFRSGWRNSKQNGWIMDLICVWRAGNPRRNARGYLAGTAGSYFVGSVHRRTAAIVEIRIRDCHGGLRISLRRVSQRIPPILWVVDSTRSASRSSEKY